MRLDDMRCYGADEIVDAVVIGTGAGGAPIIEALAAAGLSVVALEAGANHDPQQHTPDETLAAELNWMQERLSGGAEPTAFGTNNSGRGVGGSTLHWGAFVPRPDPRDLSLRRDHGLGADWPVDPAELLHHVVEVEQFLGVSGPDHHPWDAERRYPLPPPPRNAPATIMQRGCERLGIRSTDAPAALVSRDRWQPGHGLRRGCISCGACHQGCRTASKVSMDTSYLPLAVGRGAEIRPDSVVHTIERDHRGRVTAVVYRRNGVDVRQRCAHLFVCAGGVETPRLLLHTGVATSNGQVGRHFMAHGGTQVWGRFEQPVRGHRGYPSSLITEDFVRPDDVDFAGGYLLQSLGVMPGTYATTLARGGGLWGAELMDALVDYRFMAGIGMNAECLPHPDNALTLSDEVDEVGVPKALITFGAHENERRIDEHATATMTAILQAAGGTDVRVLARTAHTLGTCRMGTDPDDAVVDPEGRSFEVGNLWICDNSIFPSSLSANPGLTTMALARRTATRFLASV